MTGELTKVKILAYEDKRFQSKHGEFDLPINPEQFSQAFKVEYDLAQAQGSQGNDPRFKFTRPEELKLDFTFDGTGVVPIKGKANTFYKDVAGQVQEFLNVVYTMKNNTHKPNFLRLLWGNFSFGNKNGFDCILKDLQINYTLFSPDGKPLRAKISATFVNYIEQERRLREEGKQSPDVTHIRKVTAGDTLPLMTHRIYGDQSYYLQVAKVNGLVNFRRLATNTDLRFPPLEKTEL
ncbi:LysM peptidoglycan-binding domain-containing protein [Scytonema hofmannii FACHB-248]|uniref:LysM peptidoglycan-binding domain-containing protein n=1 Tax=Scytonema hofmannii FACHB-248 TaxID=1842502 RepID=A0ABR8GNV1_9CYAN|nr:MULTISPECIES: LysM peptidoglycan-binding domain-containing protein [Nostocales]MBD2604438.1 LysM peptidoglycan-binding domain-containing protein [Scytonema hofmannii FACHB-248]